MPISRQDMNEVGTEVHQVRSNRKLEVLEVLKKKNANGGLDAYTQGEVAKKLNIRPQHARQILMDLVQAKVVMRKSVVTGSRVLVYYAMANDPSDEDVDEDEGVDEAADDA